MSKYTKYIITSIPFLPDMLSGLLWQLDISGINEDEDSISVFISEKSETQESMIREQLENLVSHEIIKSYSIEKEEIEDKNWNEVWEMSREVIRISKRIVIKPTFKQYKKRKNEIVLSIDPKMSFGTGEHESTQLVMQLLEDYVKTGDRVLDVGSGTGILSIAAIKLGASSAVAVDNDHLCYENCVENCQLNEVVEKVEVVEGVTADIADSQFDMIAANIQKNILLEIASEIKSKTSQGGKVILAGLLIKDEDEIKNKYKSLGFKQLEIKYLNEWLAIVFEKT